MLVDPELYARVEAEASAQHTSVGAFIRDAVSERLEHRRDDARASLRRLWALADAHPSGPIDLEAEKDAMARDFLTGLE
ncbi:ribbon-helix-helix protein, CopG family [Rathayibacter sp. CAU 1779]